MVPNKALIKGYSSINKTINNFLLHPWVYWIAIIRSKGEKIKIKGIIKRTISKGIKQKNGVTRIVTITFKNSKGINNRISE